jgi:hypothetical protein
MTNGLSYAKARLHFPLKLTWLKSTAGECKTHGMEVGGGREENLLLINFVYNFNIVTSKIDTFFFLTKYDILIVRYF